MMKKTKYLISLLLCAVFIFSYCLPAFAAELTANEASGVSTVEHTVETEFTANIPAYVIPTEQGEQTAVHSLTLEKTVIPDGKELTASVIYSGLMTEGNGAELPYSLYNESGNTIQSGSTILSKAAGSPDDMVSVSFGAALSSKAKYAGVYTDTATFTFDVAEKTYSIDEINADEHLYAIGKTKPEYVVAEFNDDYTSIRIFKNGEDSDGWMKTFNWSVVPSAQHKSTLTSAVIIDGVKNLSDSFFYNCSALCNVSLPESLLEIGDVNRKSNVVGGTFDGCKALKQVLLPENLKTIGGRAFNNTGLETLVIPNSVIELGAATFSNCKSLIDVVLSQNLITIPAVCFSGDEKLSEISIPDSVETIDNSAFSYCRKLNSVLGAKNVRVIGAKAFYSTSNLNSFPMYEGLEKIGDAAFDLYITYKGGLKTVNIPSTVNYIGDKAFNCMIESISVSEDNQFFSVQNGILYSKDMTRILRAPVKNALINYTAPSTVELIDSYAFALCREIKDVDLRGCSVTAIKEYTFEYCEALQSIELPETLISIGSYAFDHNTNLKTIVFPKEMETIGDWAFGYCHSIQELELPSGLTSIAESCFWDNYSLTKVIIPNTVTVIKGDAFYGCKLLNSITLSNNLMTIGKGAFGSCGFKDIVLPESVNKIDLLAFANNNNLISITIPNSDVIIGDSMVNNCKNFSTIYGKENSTAKTFAEEHGYTFIVQ